MPNQNLGGIGTMAPEPSEPVVAPTAKPKTKIGLTIAIGLIMALIGAGAAGAGMYFFGQQSQSTLKSEQEQEKKILQNKVTDLEKKVTTLEEENKKAAETAKEETKEVTTEIENVVLVTEENQKEVILASGTKITLAKISGKLKKDELLKAFVQDGTDKNLVYFSTRIETEKSVTSTFYSYNLGGAELKKLYEKQDSKFGFYLLGRDGAKLVIFQNPIDYSPGPCANLWLVNEGDEIKYFSLNSTSKVEVTKLEAYQVSIAKKDIETRVEEQCSKDLQTSGSLSVTKRTPQGYYKESGDLTQYEVGTSLKEITLIFDTKIKKDSITKETVKITSSKTGDVDRTFTYNETEKKLTITFKTPVEPAKSTEKPVKLTVTLKNLVGIGQSGMETVLTESYEYFIDLRAK